jgi:hypothetical protein
MNLDTIIPALIAGVLGGSGVGWLFRAWVQARFETTMQERVAEFRARLDAMTATAAFEHQRQLQTHSLFIAKKAEAVTELYHRVLDAQSQVSGVVRGERDIPDIGSMLPDDAERYMVDHAGLPAGLAAQIVSHWDDRPKAVEMFETFLDDMRPEHARRAWVSANNYRLGHELFLSQSTAACASDLTGAIRRTLDLWHLQGGRNRRLDDSLREIASAMTHFRGLMQLELVTPGLHATPPDAVIP